MGQFEPARNLLMKVRKVSWIGKGKKPANKKPVFLLKAQDDETNARFLAHKGEPEMEQKDIDAVAAKVVALLKAAPDKAQAGRPADAPADDKLVNTTEAEAPANDTPAAAPVAGSMKDHIKALKDAVNPPVKPAPEDNELEEDQLVEQMQELLARFEQLQEVYEQKCNKAAGVKKGERLSPASQEEQNTNATPEDANAQNASEELEISDEEMEKFKADVRAQAEKADSMDEV